MGDSPTIRNERLSATYPRIFPPDETTSYLLLPELLTMTSQNRTFIMMMISLHVLTTLAGRLVRLSGRFAKNSHVLCDVILIHEQGKDIFNVDHDLKKISIAKILKMPEQYTEYAPRLGRRTVHLNIEKELKEKLFFAGRLDDETVTVYEYYSPESQAHGEFDFFICKGRETETNLIELFEKMTAEDLRTTTDEAEKLGPEDRSRRSELESQIKTLKHKVNR